MSKIWVPAVLLLVVIGSLGLVAAIVPGPGTVAGPTRPSSGPSIAADPPTHGDLVVAAGQTYVIQPTSAGPTYYQGGNITVEVGGTLDVENVTLSFAEYVSNTGTAEQRLSHIYTFKDAGTVNFLGANLTTDVQIINAYAKLNLSVSGTLNAYRSSFAFPGWIYVYGATARMTLNQSNVTWNPGVQTLSEPYPIYGDTLWAPTITVTGGANLTLLSSQIQHTYADDTDAFGFGRPTPLTFLDTAGVPANPGTTAFDVNGPSDSANLTLDYLYPAAGALNGYISLTYSDTQTTNTTVDLGVTYGGNPYSVATDVVIVAGSGGTMSLPFPTTLTSAISAGGMLQYLNNTGDFGVPGTVAITVDNTAGPAFTITAALFQMNTTGVSYNDMVVGSEVSAVNTQLDFNWALYNPAVGAQYSQQVPYPWLSNKWLFIDHSVGYLANISTPGNSLPGVFSASALLPDGSSQVNLYRWAQFNLTGRGGVLPIQGATLSAYYAYNSNQTNNATTAALNNLKTAAPSIWSYLQYWDVQHGVLTYGTSNAAGQGFLLLASGNLTSGTLPDGLFLGGYHIGISVPAVGVPSHWFNWSVSPYPSGVAAQTPHFNGPDVAPNQAFPDYFGDVTVFSAGMTANGAPVTKAGIDIGQTLGVKVVLNDSGTATITQVLVQLYYNTTFNAASLVAENESTTLHLTAPGQQTTFDLSWLVTDTVTGLHGWFMHNFTLAVEYNYNIPSLAGGAFNRTLPIQIAPSMIALKVTALPPSTIQLTQTYFLSGTVTYNGSEPATIELWATPTGGGTPTEIAVGPASSGNFSLQWSNLQQVYPALVPGTSYTLSAQAIYNGRTVYDNLTGTYTVPKSPTSPTSILFQTFLGLPLWLWIVIAAAAAVGIVLFLMFARRQAAGKLVECGECGNLIPEDATVCPKCGAEFESDLIRCSRCASTIPADSKFCPECAAQLLGKPGEAEADPEKQAYADFTEKYRAEAKRELGDNYTEGAFWDWWKRQPTYTPFSQWSLQQGQGTARAGMTAPPAGTQATPEAPAPGKPPKGGAPPAGWAESAPAGAAAAPKAAAAPPTPTTVPPPAPGGAGLKACPSCGKEIPAEYLVCPFCNAVTQ
jgi:hypothetical protein